MVCSTLSGSKISTGTMVEPWVTQAMTPSTQPKQWKNGTGMQSRSFSVKLHALADVEAVVDEVVVGQHHPLGEAGGAGGVLHVDDVVAVKGLLPPQPARHR